MVVADVAMWIAIIAAVDGGERAVTIHFATDYLAPARGDIIASARLLKVGRRLIVGSVDTRALDGTLVAVHQVTYALPGRTQ
jgi:acyl-coenzyme A thioesterase PaaI-like protein